MSATITRNGMKVDCYGDYDPDDAAVLVIGTFANGDELEHVTDLFEVGVNNETPQNWTEVVEHLTDWAKQHGHEVNELSPV